MRRRVVAVAMMARSPDARPQVAGGSPGPLSRIADCRRSRKAGRAALGAVTVARPLTGEPPAGGRIHRPFGSNSSDPAGATTVGRPPGGEPAFRLAGRCGLGALRTGAVLVRTSRWPPAGPCTPP